MKYLKKVQSLPTELEENVLYYAIEDNKVGVKKVVPVPSYITRVWYKDGSYKEYDIEGILEGQHTYPSYGQESWIPTSLIENAENVTKCIVGDKITEIKNYAFFSGFTSFGEGEKKSELQEIVLTNKVTNIGEKAFFAYPSLTSVTIGNGVTSIGANAFCGCGGLIEIIIPDTVTSIADGAFAECLGLTSVTIGNGVTSIDARAFGMCPSLRSVTIGNSVTSIGEYTFYRCLGLNSVTYNGTTAQWNGIVKGDNWKYNVPSTCIVHCTDGDISIADV